MASAGSNQAGDRRPPSAPAGGPAPPGPSGAGPTAPGGRPLGPLLPRLVHERLKSRPPAIAHCVQFLAQLVGQVPERDGILAQVMTRSVWVPVLAGELVS